MSRLGKTPPGGRGGRRTAPLAAAAALDGGREKANVCSLRGSLTRAGTVRPKGWPHAGVST